MEFHTADLCDAHEALLKSGELRLVPPPSGGWVCLGKQARFCGEIVTLSAEEDNTLVRAELEQKSTGKVLVVDGRGSMRCALLGGNLGKLAERNGWAGVFIYGAARDSQELNACNVGIRALGLSPVKSQKLGRGQRGVALSISGVSIKTGEWIYADEDGILIAPKALSA